MDETYRLIDLRDLPADQRQACFTAFHDDVLVPAFPDATEREAPADLWRLIDRPAAVQPRVRLVVAHTGEPSAPRAGVVAEYYRAADCGLVTYIAVAQDARGGGLSRRLIDAALAAMASEAAQAGRPAPLVLCELQNPERAPPAAAGIDPGRRRLILGRLGFARLDMRYVQPALGPGKPAADWLWLAVHRASLPPGTDRVPAARIGTFLDRFCAGLGVDWRAASRLRPMRDDLERQATIAVRSL